MIRTDYKQSVNDGNRAMQTVLITPLYLCMIAGTGGVYTPASLQVWAEQPNQVVQIRGYHSKRERILSVSERLVQIRDTFGMTMTDLATVLGVSRPTAYSWINGVITPKEPKTNSLISKLGAHADALRHAGVARVPTLARRPLSNGQSLIDVLKAGKDASKEIESMQFASAQAPGQSRTRRDFGPASKVRRVRVDEISTPVAADPGGEA
jgi:DNA-binding transcriptional regulator YiaG